MMMQVIQIMALPILLLTLALLAQVFGADSRDGLDWQTRDLAFPGPEEHM